MGILLVNGHEFQLEIRFNNVHAKLKIDQLPRSENPDLLILVTLPLLILIFHGQMNHLLQDAPGVGEGVELFFNLFQIVFCF